MAWIEFHSARVKRLKKFHDFRHEMNWTVIQALGFLGSFWGEVVEVGERGDVTDWQPAYVGQLIGLSDAEAEVAWSALERHGWLDKTSAGRLLIHDWLDTAGLFLTRKYSTSNLPMLREIWRLHGRVYGSERKANNKRTKSEPTVPNRTVPNQTLPNRTNQRKSGGKFVPPTPQEVATYADSLGYALDGRRFCDHYAAKGWVVGKAPMRDWQAAVRTWRGRDQEVAHGRRTADPRTDRAAALRAVEESLDVSPVPDIAGAAGG